MWKITKGDEQEFKNCPDWVTATFKSAGYADARGYVSKWEVGADLSYGDKYKGPSSATPEDKLIGYFEVAEPIAIREWIEEKDDGGWIEWNGGECPVPKGTLVDVKLRDGREAFIQDARVNGVGSWASLPYWRHDGLATDIIAWRLHQPEQQTWDGEGLPPVGCECEVYKNSSECNTQWVAVKVMYFSEFTVVMKELNGGSGEIIHHPRTLEFRTIRTEAERKREEIVKELRSHVTNFNKTDVLGAIEEIYDAIAEGKIKRLKLEE